MRKSTKAGEASRNINMVFGEGTTNDRDETLEVEQGRKRKTAIEKEQLMALVIIISNHLREIGESNKLEK